MEGLEISEISFSEAMKGTETSRIDPEYFNRAALETLKLIKGTATLGDLVKDGYRVVYETTEAIDRDVGQREGLPFFLQAADITTPFINAESMVCVAEADWIRYPKGRIQPGELLIEVKGKAEKIAFVPDDFPEKTLVTGTCFKLTTKDRLDQYFLAAYLTCHHGQILKDRLKSNLLVSYLAKDDLFRLPVPTVSRSLKEMIKFTFDDCFTRYRESEVRMKSAETALLEALDLDDWIAPEPLTYTRRSSDAFAAGRLDAEYQQPKYEALREELSSRFALSTASDLGQVTKGVTVQYAEDGSIPIIRSGDLRDIDSDDAFLRAHPTEPVFFLEKGDILISSISFGSIGKVQVFDKEGRYGTVGEVTVIRQRQVNPYYLATFLRSKAGQMQIERHITGATGQLHLYPRDVASFWIPLLPTEDQAEFERLAKEARASKQRAAQLLESAKRAVEIAIEDSEAAALTYLEESVGRGEERTASKAAVSEMRFAALTASYAAYDEGESPKTEGSE